MAKYLLIAEKPSLSKAIKEAYESLSNPGFKADFFALHGHFMEAKEPDEYSDEWGKPWRKEVLPMIPDTFKYNVKSDCKTDYKKLKDLITNGNYDALVNCCDAGREGEAIFWTLINTMKVTNHKVLRLWAQDTTVETLGKALMDLLDYDKNVDLVNLRDSSLCRIEFDWLVGMNLSRATMLATRTKASVGRVKSPTLNIVVQRDLEIANFVPKDYFEVVGHFDDYKGTWFDPKTKETSFSDKAKAEALVKSCGKTGTITEVKKEKVVTNAPAPYSLAELQKEANRAFGFTASQTLDLAQSLYETHKILSYPRTESRALSTALAKEIPDLLKALKDVPEVQKQIALILSEPDRIKKVCGSKKYVDNKKVTDHHAIINTKVKPNLNKLSDNERKLFILVIKKFVAIFLDPYVTNKTTIITDVDKNKFKTTGSVVADLGFKELYKGDKAEKEDEELLPDVKKGDVVGVKKMQIVAKQTTPPSYYTDAELIQAMQHAGKFVDDEKMKEVLDDAKGIGTSATRAGIIDDLIKKEFLYRNKKTIRATEFGIATIKSLEGKNVISPALTAEWEEKLQNIENGNITVADFKDDMESYIKDETDAHLMLNKSGYSGSSNREVIGKCPKCGKDVVMTAKYVMCSTYKKPDEVDCDFITGIVISGTKVPKTEFKKILEGKPTKKMKFKSMKTGKQFEAILKFDDVDGKIKFVFDNK